MPAMAGPTMRVALKTALLSATALATSSRPHHLDHERLPDGHVESVHAAQQQRQNEDLPDLHGIREDQ
jgi:hypothetical protein